MMELKEIKNSLDTLKQLLIEKKYTTKTDENFKKAIKMCCDDLKQAIECHKKGDVGTCNLLVNRAHLCVLIILKTGDFKNAEGIMKALDE